MNSIFYNESGRLRSGWRAALFLAAFSFFATAWEILMDILRSISVLGLERDSLRLWIATLFFSLTLAVLLGWACGRLLEDLPLKALGWSFYRRWYLHLFAGLLTGAASLALACLIGVVFGGMTFGWNERAGMSGIGLTLTIAGIFFLANSASEETIFRGYLLQTFTRARLAWLAILLTSAFFAMAHVGNSYFSAFALINTLLAGLWFSAAYLKTRSLWLPFGAHFTWNWFQGAIFGIPVSGITKLTTAPLLAPANLGPEWLTGGAYGIEGGAACTIALAISTALIWFAPWLKANEEMLRLTSRENPKEELAVK